MNGKVSSMKISIFAAGMKAARELEQALWSYGDSLEEELSLRVFTQPAALLKDCRDFPPDALFFILPDPPPGKMELLERFQVDFPRSLLIIVGSRPEYALNAFQLGAAYYLLPPYSWKELERCYQRCVRLFARTPATLKLTKNRKIYKLPLANLIYVSVTGKQTCFYLQGQQEPLCANCSLAQVSQKLHDRRFVRCYRNIIVNLDYVTKIQPEGISLQSGTVLPYARHNRVQLLHAYQNHMLRHPHAYQDAAVDLIHYKERLHLALKTAHICVFEVDLRNQLYTFFDNSEDIFGVSDDVILSDVASFAKLSPEEYRRAATNYFSHPDDAQVIANAFKEIFAGHHTSYEARMKAGNSKFTWCRLDLQPILANGVPVRMIGAIIALKRKTWRRKAK